MALSKYLLFIIAVIAGATLPFAFAPHDLWPLAILSPAVLLWIWQKPTLSSKQAFLTGLGYGFGMFGMGVSWVFVSIHYFGNTEIPLAVFITSILVVVLSLFIATQGYFLKRFFRGSSLSFCLLGFSSSWVLFEWLRSWLFGGFPWLYLGYTQLNTPLSGYAPLASVYGISFVVLLSSGILIRLFKGTHKTKIVLSSVIIFVWGIGFLLKEHRFTLPSSQKPYTVSLIQGNINPFDKFSQANPILATEQTYGHLTEKEWGQDLILWPEGAIPLPLPYSQPYLNQLQNIAFVRHSTLITGIQIINEKTEYYNSLIALGEGSGTYHKYHLLPFGDFVPFEQWLRGLIDFFDLPMSSFVSGSQNQPLITAGKLKLDPLICYEITFPELVRDTLRHADAIITLSEDGWFGSSWGPHQHLQIAQMRALETGRYVLRATTSGITAIIDPKGKLAATIPQFQATVLRGSFYAMQGETPWNRTGFWPLLIILIGCFIVPGRFYPFPFVRVL